MGILFPDRVNVKDADGIENKSGSMYAALVSRVVKNPIAGSDEVSRAFDECWIGSNGYLTQNGDWQQRAIAFQGNVLDHSGKMKTEIFVVDIPATLPQQIHHYASAGTMTTLPEVPECIRQRRISFTPKGVSPSPRHWLRSVPDGSLIGFLAEDDAGIIQLWEISPNGGMPKQLTQLSVSITGPFNFSPDGKWVAYTAGSNIYLTRLSDSFTKCVSKTGDGEEPILGDIHWSPDGKMLAYNKYVLNKEGRFLQIFLMPLLNE